MQNNRNPGANAPRTDINRRPAARQPVNARPAGARPASPANARPAASRPTAARSVPPRSRSRYRKQRNTRRMIIAGAAILIAIIVILIFALRKPAADTSVPVMQEMPVETALPATPTPEPTATPEPSPTPRNDVADPAYAALRPKAKEGWLPIFSKIETGEKIIAVTVDDCYQADNLRKIVDIALENNAKLTIFPIGEVALRDAQAQTLKYAWENGMELENHTFTHNGLYGCTDEELAEEIYKQNLALSKILNVEYQAHFLRPMGGDARADQRIHAYINQLGYYGVAHWSQSGTRSVSKLKGILAPGNIYLFHTTDKDLKRLEYFIPYAVSQGYRLVTMNELFGYPPNEYTELTTPIAEHTIPPLEEYEKVYVTYEEGSYAYGVLEMQQRLVDLGYLSGGADGIYGGNSTKAIKMFQTVAGLKVTGKANAETQKLLFSADAPRNTYDTVEEILAKQEKK